MPPGKNAAGLKQTEGFRGRYLCVEGEIARPGGAVATWRPDAETGHGHGGGPASLTPRM